MIMPDLKDIFFKYDFSDDTMSELEDADSEVKKILDKLSTSHKLTYPEIDVLIEAINNNVVMAQCNGFIQGFKWAVFLFTGHKDEEIQKVFPTGELKG